MKFKCGDQVNFGPYIGCVCEIKLLPNGLQSYLVAYFDNEGKYCTVNCIVPIARTRLTTEVAPAMIEMMNTKRNEGFDVFDPANVAPLVLYLASEEAADINGEVLRISGDKCYVFSGWQTVKEISNNGKSFTYDVLANRVKTELLKDIPPKKTLADAIDEIIKG